jgi:PTS system nitrogen regulatory IIA component
MKLGDIVCFDALVADLKAKTRDTAIAELVAALAQSGKLGKADAAKISKAVVQREREASTGIGKGVAVPHVKHADVPEVVAAVAAGLYGDPAPESGRQCGPTSAGDGGDFPSFAKG